MGPKRQQSLSTSVARLYVTTSQTGHREWMTQVTGAICFVKDFERRSYYIMVRGIKDV